MQYGTFFFLNSRIFQDDISKMNDIHLFACKCLDNCQLLKSKFALISSDILFLILLTKIRIMKCEVH